MTATRGTDPYAPHPVTYLHTRRSPFVLAETFPDATMRAELIEPWLAAVAAHCTPTVLAVARDLAHRTDGRDGTVNASIMRAGASWWAHDRAVAALTEAGLLVHTAIGRCRLVVPEHPASPAG